MIIDKPVGECDRSVIRIDLNQCNSMLKNIPRLEKLVAMCGRTNRKMVLIGLDAAIEHELLQAIQSIERRTLQ